MALAKFAVVTLMAVLFVASAIAQSPSPAPVHSAPETEPPSTSNPPPHPSPKARSPSSPPKKGTSPPPKASAATPESDQTPSTTSPHLAPAPSPSGGAHNGLASFGSVALAIAAGFLMM